jgi:hypothetical protein
MDFIDKIKDLENRFKELNSHTTENRLSKLTDYFYGLNLDINELNDSELLLFHTKIHNEFHKSKSKIPLDNLKEYHTSIKKRIKNHCNFDELDFFK